MRTDFYPENGKGGNFPKTAKWQRLTLAVLYILLLADAAAVAVVMGSPTVIAMLCFLIWAAATGVQAALWHPGQTLGGLRCFLILLLALCKTLFALVVEIFADGNNVFFGSDFPEVTVRSYLIVAGIVLYALIGLAELIFGTATLLADRFYRRG